MGIVMISSSSLFAARSSDIPAYCDIRQLDTNGNGIYEEGEVDPCTEYRCGPVRCTYPVTKFKRRTYCTKRCVKEPYTVRKKCVRYRPEYYTKTYCKKVPECYYTCETRYRTRVVNDEHCCYEPYTYCKTACLDMNDCGECDQGGCPTGQVYNRGYYHQNYGTSHARAERKSRHY